MYSEFSHSDLFFSDIWDLCLLLWLRQAVIVSNSVEDLLLMLSYYPFSFNTCFILAFSLAKSSLLVIMEFAVLNKKKQHFPWNLFGGKGCSVGIGQYALASYIPI